MECNRGEAERAKEIAERKLEDKDFSSAMKFALKAQKLFPELDGIAQFITIVDLQLKGESKVAGENDWYAIMSLNPSDDESTVRKQYRRLVLQLHPDKNSSKGAEDAFKLVQEAFGVLKDKDKRFLFDQKRKTHAVYGYSMGSAGFSSNVFNNKEKGAGADMHFRFQAQGNPQKAARPVPQPSPSTAGCREQGAPQSAARPVPRPLIPKTASCTRKHASQTTARPKQRRPEQPVPQSLEDTFWTRCTSCRMWFEYSLIYAKLHLLCRSCIKPFYAADEGQPVVRYKFEHIQDWKCSNLGSAVGSNGSCNSENVSVGSGTQQQGQPYKRMRGEASSNSNGGSS